MIDGRHRGNAKSNEEKGKSSSHTEILPVLYNEKVNAAQPVYNAATCNTASNLPQVLKKERSKYVYIVKKNKNMEEEKNNIRGRSKRFCDSMSLCGSLG